MLHNDMHFFFLSKETPRLENKAEDLHSAPTFQGIRVRRCKALLAPRMGMEQGSGANIRENQS